MNKSMNSLQKPAPVWDLPLRVFHWGLLIAVVGAIASAKNGEMYWHQKSGLTELGLVAFRLIWGVIGSHHARFRNFMVGPRRVLAYIAERRGGDRSVHPGHAPTGAYATLALLAVLLGMALLGAMSNDDILYEGPLAAYVGSFTNRASDLHHIGEKLVFFLIAAHLAAILIYRYVLKIKLLPAMVNGGQDPKITPITPLRQAIGFAVMAATLAAAHSLSNLGDRFF
ncbi:MAG: cytochrome b/b6 domain-containing protein [Alphaproteobacteria bacterium]|nr:cytochrome b/b6 domain-containing protein [Alphaproteobacteria bacterium]